MKSYLLAWVVLLPGFLVAGTQPPVSQNQEETKPMPQKQAAQQQAPEEFSLPKTVICKVRMNTRGEEEDAACVSSTFDQRVTNAQLAHQANASLAQQGQSTEWMRLGEAGENTPSELRPLFDLQALIAVDPIHADQKGGMEADASRHWNYYGNRGFYGYGHRGSYGYNHRYNYRHANYGYWWRGLVYPYVNYGYYYPYGGYNYYYYSNPYYY